LNWLGHVILNNVESEMKKKANTLIMLFIVTCGCPLTSYPNDVQVKEVDIDTSEVPENLAEVAINYTSQGAAPAKLCPEPPKETNASEEGIGGPIPEEAFTEAAARAELDRLKSLTDAKAEATDSYVWGNSFILIEGWLLRKKALLPVEERPPHAVEDFCAFLKERAHLSD
jgi:hypothetical protein